MVYRLGLDCEKGDISTDVVMVLWVGCSGTAYLFDIITRHEAGWLFFIFSSGLLLCFPPAIVLIFIENIEKVSIIDGELTLGLRHVIVESPVNSKKPHGGKSLLGSIGCTAGVCASRKGSLKISYKKKEGKNWKKLGRSEALRCDAMRSDAVRRLSEEQATATKVAGSSEQ